MNKNLLMALILALASGVAVAASFEEVDANSDGAISQDEATAVEGLDFAAADTDSNGSLSAEEFTAAMAE